MVGPRHDTVFPRLFGLYVSFAIQFIATLVLVDTCFMYSLQRAVLDIWEPSVEWTVKVLAAGSFQHHY